MSEVDIHALKQNAWAVVAAAASGEVVVITDRGRPVAQLTPILASPLQRLRAAGRIRPARCDIRELPSPKPGPDLSTELASMRNAERF